MELVECTPYIRFANILRFESQRGPSKTYDCRALYTMQGSGSIVLEGQRRPMKPGVLVLFQPGTEYIIQPSPSLLLAVLDYDYTQTYSDTTDFLVPCPAARFLPEQAHDRILFSDFPGLNQPLYTENGAFLEAAFQNLITEFQQSRLFFHGKVSTMFKDILFDLARAMQSGGEFGGTVSRVLDYIEQNLSRPLTNKEIGEALNYNPNYLNRLILQHTGMSLHQYLLRRRLTLAATLIHSTELPIGEIAMMLGFHSPSHFSNYFKQTTGTSPAQYRKNSAL